MTNYDLAAAMVFNEYAGSVEKYGHWPDYSPMQMLEVIRAELCEATAAAHVADLDGEHGVMRELAQIAACCHKGIMALANQLALAERSPAATIHPDEVYL